MMKSFGDLFDQPNDLDSKQEFFFRFGCITFLAVQSRLRQRQPMAYIDRIILPALKHEQVKIFYDYRGSPVGFVVWAFLSDLVERRFLEDGAWNLHESEWNEGSNLWIIDVGAPKTSLRKVLRTAIRSLPTGIPVIKYARQRQGLLICFEYERQE